MEFSNTVFKKVIFTVQMAPKPRRVSNDDFHVDDKLDVINVEKKGFKTWMTYNLIFVYFTPGF